MLDSRSRSLKAFFSEGIKLTSIEEKVLGTMTIGHPGQAIIRVAHFNYFDSDYPTDATNTGDYNLGPLPYGYVLKKGSDFPYEVGDYLKLQDFLFLLYENPLFKAFHARDNNAEIVGKEPNPISTRFFDVFKTAMIKLNPGTRYPIASDYFTIMIGKDSIVGKIEDPNVFLDAIDTQSKIDKLKKEQDDRLSF